MKKLLRVVLVIIVSVVLIGCFGDNKKRKSPPIVSKKNTDMELVKALKKKDCAEFIKCLSAKTIAKEYGRTEQWAVANYKVNVWEKTSAKGKGKKVGEMRCNSRALIIDRSGDDYKILSPLDKSIGWVNKIQIEETIYQNPNTYEECKGY
jgi:hypothetical protein